MPQASDEQRKAWGGQQGVGDDKAIKYLKSRGYLQTSKWNWLIPIKDDSPSNDDLEAAAFLVDEWDWGWFVRELAPTEKVIYG